MKKNNENPEISWRTIRGNQCLYFTFIGEFTEVDAKTGIQKWKTLLAKSTRDTNTLVWNCLEMRGYTPEARTIWQNTLRQLKPKIHAIWLISDSRLIRQGARIISLFISLKIYAVSNESEIRL